MTNNPSNPKNVFDYIGQIHNQIVYEFLIQTGGQTLTNQQVLDKVKLITLANPDYISHFGTNYQDIKEAEVDAGIDDFPNQFENIIDGLPISSEAKGIFNALMTETFEIENSGLTYAKYRTYVLDLEDNIINNTTIPSNEKNGILYSTSVARYSSYFWLESNPPTSQKKFFGWVIAGDVVGGIVGAFIANVLGAISGASSASGLVHTLNESK